MALFTRTELKNRVATQRQQDPSFRSKSTTQILAENRNAIPLGTPFDIFLCHCTDDAELVIGLMLILKDIGYSVYVDWVVDAQMNRTQVTRENADQLRKRMKTSSSLFYASTQNSADSKWMPWETGYFDAHKGKVAIVPILYASQTNDRYEGQEYLGLYPYVSARTGPYDLKPTLYIHESEFRFMPFKQWLNS